MSTHIPASPVARRGHVRLVSALAVAFSALMLLAVNVPRAEAVPPEVVSRWDNEIVHSNALGGTAGIVLPSTGPYTLTAKLSAQNTGGTPISYTCLISAEGGADTDHAFVTLAPGAQAGVYLNVVHNFTGNRMVSFGCTKPAGAPTVMIKQLKITAIKVNSLDNQPL